MITENLSTLKIHKLTQEQYDRALEAGNIDASALYLTPEEEIDLSPYATKAEVEQLKTSVSEGKALIASAVTDMGVQTADDATFAIISSNIKSISSDATAVASDIASGKTAYVNGSKVTGNVYTVSTSSSQDADSVLFHDSSTYDDGSYDITFKKTFTSDTLYRAGSVCKLTQASSNLGDATAADVAAGKTFTSAAGLKVTGTKVNTEIVQESITAVYDENGYDGSGEWIITTSRNIGELIAFSSYDRYSFTYDETRYYEYFWMFYNSAYGSSTEGVWLLRDRDASEYTDVNRLSGEVNVSGNTISLYGESLYDYSHRHVDLNYTFDVVYIPA